MSVLYWTLKLLFLALQLAPSATFLVPPPRRHDGVITPNKQCCKAKQKATHRDEDILFQKCIHPIPYEDTSSCSVSVRRRHLLALVGAVAATTTSACSAQNANAAPFFWGKPDNSLYTISPINRNATNSLMRTSTDIRPYETSVELCLLKLLPVKNPLFRQLEASIENLSSLRGATERDAEAWKNAAKNLQFILDELDRKRGQFLIPTFDPDVDDTFFQITKNVRCEERVEKLRQLLVELQKAAQLSNTSKLFAIQKEALLTLSDVGELLVSKYPYQVPVQGKFSYLPRLQGRARVTFTFRRFGSILGNVTVIADGFAAPITAGNFVDLAVRNFYTGLPVKFSKRGVGGIGVGKSEFEVANLPILGSFQEGFYDPLTAKPRRIPLEIIRLEKSTGVPNLSYSKGLSTLPTGLRTSIEPPDSSRPLLSFKTPGIVAMYHLPQNLNGASSEFFALQKHSMLEEKRALLDGEFAPFGFIVEGYDVFQELRVNDVISGTYVDDWGQLNLIKIRRSSFSEVVQGDGKKDSDAEE